MTTVRATTTADLILKLLVGGQCAEGTLIGPPRARVGSPSTEPSGSVIDTNSPPLEPSLSGLSTSVTWSPGLMLVDFQPWRLRLFGLFNSTCHVSLTPLALGTSRWIQACG